MEDDRSFYERRLHEELARAVVAGDAGLRALHRRWAVLYKNRLAQFTPSGQPSPAGTNKPRQSRRNRSNA